MKKNVQAQLKKKEIFLQHLVYNAISVVISSVLLCMAYGYMNMVMVIKKL
jgi:hypothetical protein